MFGDQFKTEAATIKSYEEYINFFVTSRITPRFDSIKADYFKEKALIFFTVSLNSGSKRAAPLSIVKQQNGKLGINYKQSDYSRYLATTDDMAFANFILEVNKSDITGFNEIEFCKIPINLCENPFGIQEYNRGFLPTVKLNFQKPGITFDEFIKTNFTDCSAVAYSPDGEVINDISKTAGTGCFVYFIDYNENVISMQTIVIPGDVDGNGSVEALDARIALRASAELESLTQAGINACLCGSENPDIQASDARKILRFSANLISFEEFTNSKIN